MHKKTKQFTTTLGNCAVLNICNVGVKSVNSKGTYRLLCAGPRAACGRRTVGCTPKYINYCVNFTIYRVFQEEISKLWEVMSSVIARKRVHINMCLSLNGYRERELFECPDLTPF